MSSKILTFKYNNHEIKLNCNLLTDPSSQGIGLMFKSYSKAKISAFIFDPARKVEITTFFCFFPILILFFKGKKLVDFKVVKTFKTSISSKFEVDNIVEIPLKKGEFEILDRIKDNQSMIKSMFHLEKVKSSTGTKALNISSS
jgi:hypothetical protein